MNQEQSGVCKDHCCGIKCLSWTAVITGAVVAIGLSFLLNLLITAMGLTVHTTSPEGGKHLAIGGFISIAVGVMIVMFIAGWVSGALGRMHNCIKCNMGVLYGFTTWSLTLIFTVLLASSIGQFMAMQYEAMNNAPTNITLKISSPMASSGTTMHAGAGQASAKTTEVTMHDEKAKVLGITLMLVFVLFLLGAVMSCIGGYVGMKHCDKKKF